MGLLNRFDSKLMGRIHQLTNRIGVSIIGIIACSNRFPIRPKRVVHTIGGCFGRCGPPSDTGGSDSSQSPSFPTTTKLWEGSDKGPHQFATNTSNGRSPIRAADNRSLAARPPRKKTSPCKVNHRKNLVRGGNEKLCSCCPSWEATFLGGLVSLREGHGNGPTEPQLQVVIRQQYDRVFTEARSFDKQLPICGRNCVSAAHVAEDLRTSAYDDRYPWRG